MYPSCPSDIEHKKWYAYYAIIFTRNNRITSEGAVLIGKGVSLNETLTVLRVSKKWLYVG